jgi:hypothetical protein
VLLGFTQRLEQIGLRTLSIAVSQLLLSHQKPSLKQLPTSKEFMQMQLKNKKTRSPEN